MNIYSSYQNEPAKKSSTSIDTPRRTFTLLISPVDMAGLDPQSPQYPSARGR
jgi:hypothetical protein